MKRMLCACALSMLMLNACSVGGQPIASVSPEPTQSREASTAINNGYELIDQAKAKRMMDENPQAIVLDVRTDAEYVTGHIPGAVLLPVDEVKARAAEVLPDKNAVILVYCRSGNRSKTASEELVSLGYVRVYEFGGINDWEYEIEK